MTLGVRSILNSPKKVEVKFQIYTTHEHSSGARFKILFSNLLSRTLNLLYYVFDLVKKARIIITYLYLYRVFSKLRGSL
jgi:hypothetical protein